MANRNQNTVYETFLILLNMLACIILSGMAAYKYAWNSTNFWLNVLWTIPLVYMLVIFGCNSNAYRSGRHTVINIAIIGLSMLLLWAPPQGSSLFLQWAYPLAIGVCVHWWIDLDKL